MNRKERKRVEKQLGINKHIKTLNREQKFERMRTNIENGKKTHQEFIERTALSELAQMEQKESDIIANIATNIAKRESIPFIDAMEKAKIEFKK